MLSRHFSKPVAPVLSLVVSVASVLYLLVGCGDSNDGGSSGGLTPPGEAGVTSIVLTVEPTEVVVDPGGSVAVTVTASGNLGEPVELGLADLPAGISGVFDPPSTTTTSVLTLTAARNVPAATFPITVRGRTGGASSAQRISLSVNAPASPFDLVVAPASIAITRGQSFAIAVNVVRNGAFVGPVDVTVASPPAGFVASPFVVPANATSGILNVSTSPQLVPGTKVDLTVTGTSGEAQIAGNVEVSVAGAPGVVDTTFGTAGRALPGLAGFTFAAATQQADGKLLVAWTAARATLDLAVTRFTVDGAVDAAFGTAGTSFVDMAGTDDVASSLVVQPDGKVVVAGWTATAGGNDFAVVRLTTAGALDGTFGTGGKVTTAVSVGDDQSRGVAIAAGKVIVVGKTATEVAVVRYAANGVPDATFGTAGIARTVLPNLVDVSAVATSGDKVMVAATGTAAGGAMTVLRYTTGGALDPTFDTDGMVSVDFGATSAARTLVLQADGKVLVGGTANVGGGASMAVARLTGAGALDAAFGTAGRTVATGVTDGSDITVAGDNRILFAGAASGDFAVVRLGTDGKVDGTFGGVGRAAADFGGNTEIARAVRVREDGRIVAIGTSDGPGAALAITRFWP